MPNRTPKLLYTDDAPAPVARKPRRKKYPRGKYPRPLTSESRDVKLLRLPYMQQVTIGQAAELCGVPRRSFQANYLYPQTYRLPDYIELIRDVGRIVGIKRVGP